MKGVDIINKILNELEIKAPTLANNIGFDYQRIFDIQSGKTKKISGEVANAIISVYPKFNITWILTGEGEMLNWSYGVELPAIDSSIIIPVEVWNLIKEQNQTMRKQANSLEKKDKQIDRMIALLESQVVEVKKRLP
ncbi:MAG: hypothetical protein EZS26_002865 [Candidatus Ordinivivax streblomastigis]|uniref:Uncharacterized protein n=1 Tax=Candidatus Ordinivivax streblomastigis TaxID=2540710 RepID=A0A5M8NW97_9BACT|nr:MAG: hypothetical protein EZS26_002865 [Candidatus Ordinivivax streblomastigis]